MIWINEVKAWNRNYICQHSAVQRFSCLWKRGDCPRESAYGLRGVAFVNRLTFAASAIAMVCLCGSPVAAQSAGSCIGVVSQDDSGDVVLEYQQDGIKMYCEQGDAEANSVILKACRLGKRCEVLGMFEEIGDNGTDRWIRVVFKARELD